GRRLRPVGRLGRPRGRGLHQAARHELDPVRARQPAPAPRTAMTEPTLRRTLEHLERLVAFDTRNPPRAIAGDHGLFAYCRDMLQRSGLTCEIVDLGDG